MNINNNNLYRASGENESLRKAIQRAEKDYEANTLAIRWETWEGKRSWRAGL